MKYLDGRGWLAFARPKFPNGPLLCRACIEQLNSTRLLTVPTVGFPQPRTSTSIRPSNNLFQTSASVLAPERMANADTRNVLRRSSLHRLQDSPPGARRPQGAHLARSPLVSPRAFRPLDPRRRLHRRQPFHAHPLARHCLPSHPRLPPHLTQLPSCPASFAHEPNQRLHVRLDMAAHASPFHSRPGPRGCQSLRPGGGLR